MRTSVLAMLGAIILSLVSPLLGFAEVVTDEAKLALEVALDARIPTPGEQNILNRMTVVAARESSKQDPTPDSRAQIVETIKSDPLSSRKANSSTPVVLGNETPDSSLLIARLRQTIVARERMLGKKQHEVTILKQRIIALAAENRDVSDLVRSYFAKVEKLNQEIARLQASNKDLVQLAEGYVQKAITLEADLEGARKANLSLTEQLVQKGMQVISQRRLIVGMSIFIIFAALGGTAMVFVRKYLWVDEKTKHALLRKQYEYLKSLVPKDPEISGKILMNMPGSTIEFEIPDQLGYPMKKANFIITETTIKPHQVRVFCGLAIMFGSVPNHLGKCVKCHDIAVATIAAKTEPKYKEMKPATV